MARKSLAFLITLSVMLSASWSALAQDKEMLLGTWRLSGIEDDSGDRSEEIGTYLDVGTLTFSAKAGGDTLDLYFDPKDNLSADTISISNLFAFEVNEDKDSLIAAVLSFTIPSHYVFDGDSLVTFVMADTVINGFIEGIKPVAGLLPDYAPLVPILDQVPPYEGTASFTFTRVEEEEEVTSIDRADELPETSTLAQNYPNPFNPSTEIVYYLDESGPVRLEVFDMAGKRIATLVEAVLPQGEHRARFDAGGLPTGTYVYRLTIGSGTNTLTKTMTLVR